VVRFNQGNQSDSCLVSRMTQDPSCTDAPPLVGGWVRAQVAGDGDIQGVGGLRSRPAYQDVQAFEYLNKWNCFPGFYTDRISALLIAFPYLAI
jgi:hypothetical protein